MLLNKIILQEVCELIFRQHKGNKQTEIVTCLSNDIVWQLRNFYVYLLLQLNLRSNILELKKASKKPNGSIPGIIDPFALFICQTADDDFNDYIL